MSLQLTAKLRICVSLSFKQAIVSGIVESIRRAHINMKPSTIYHIEGELSDANINRSPTSYDANPLEERKMYEHNTDHTFVQLNIFDAVTEKARSVHSKIIIAN